MIHFSILRLTETQPWIYSSDTHEIQEIEMLTLVLVVGLCFDAGCIYDNVTSKFDIQSDADCIQIANFANSENAMNKKDPRFSCMSPEQYMYLAAKEM